MQNDAGRTKAAATSLLIVGGFLAALLVFELGLQVYSQLVIYPQLDTLLQHRRHYLVKSADPVLGYELAAGFHAKAEGRSLAINQYGLRESSDSVYEGRHKLAILGDSVVMSFGHSQEEAIDELLERSLRRAGDDTVVLNFGVGGYGFAELVRLLEVKNDIYRARDVLYLLNPNDYTRRDTIYEGADNGTYRLYYRPLFKTRWFVGKALYRYMKGRSGAFVSADWYRWLYRGNEDHGRESLLAMRDYCRKAGCRFSVVLYPVGAAYTEDGYALGDMYDEISIFLEQEGVPCISPIETFGSDPDRFFDPTDHLKPDGNEALVRALHAFLAEQGVVHAPS